MKYHNDYFGDSWREKPVIPNSRRIFRQAIFGTEYSELLFKLRGRHKRIIRENQNPAFGFLGIYTLSEIVEIGKTF